MLSLKDIKELQSSGKARRTMGLFVAEGIKIHREAPADLIEQVCASESFAKEHADVLAAFDNKTLQIVPDNKMKSLSDTKTPQGILTIMKKPVWEMESLLGKPSPFFLILENLQDPGNAGTILRTAEAAGCDGVFVTEGTVDYYTPKTIRSTMGSIYRVPHLVVPDVHSLVADMEGRGIAVYAAHLKGQKTYRQVDFTKGCAIVIGNESKGISDGLAEACTELVTIPMQGKIESLNAAMAAGIMMYEAAGQRAGE
ncbi:MAG: RNA methyltransferase [Lachnospiraceae bacterium]|nr:RNA methyltransferase [Candidatus Equihabitans merdae]